MQRSMVDFPDPDPPMIATTSPFLAVRETSFRTSSLPNDLCRPVTRMASSRASSRGATMRQWMGCILRLSRFLLVVMRIRSNSASV